MPQHTTTNTPANTPANTGFDTTRLFGNLFNTVLSGAALNDITNRLRNIGSTVASGAERFGREGAEMSAFRPFTVTTGFGGIDTTPEGGFTTSLSPEAAAMQAGLGGITSDLLSNFNRNIPGLRRVQRDAFGGIRGALEAAQAPLDDRVSSVYDQIRAVQRPEEGRSRLALQEELQAQGRTGLRTAQFGGSPEAFAQSMAQEEARNRAALSAIQQAQAEQQQQLETASSLFSLGSGAAGLAPALQESMLGNIRTSLGLSAFPEQQLLASLGPAINLASIADLGRREGAGLLTEGGVSGLETRASTELGLANLYGDIYSSVLGGMLSPGGSGSGNSIIDAILGRV